VCNGTLLSREQYMADITKGYVDARIGPMTEDEVRAWTEAIGRR